MLAWKLRLCAQTPRAGRAGPRPENAMAIHQDSRHLHRSLSSRTVVMGCCSCASQLRTCYCAAEERTEADRSILAVTGREPKCRVSMCTSFQAAFSLTSSISIATFDAITRSPGRALDGSIIFVMTTHMCEPLAFVGTQPGSVPNCRIGGSRAAPVYTASESVASHIFFRSGYGDLAEMGGID